MDTTLKQIIMEHDKIYSFLYGHYMRDYPPDDSCNEIIEISTSRLEWSRDEQTGFFVWGYPGPDFNKYTLLTLNTDWAFDKETLEKYAEGHR